MRHKAAIQRRLDTLSAACLKRQLPRFGQRSPDAVTPTHGRRVQRLGLRVSDLQTKPRPPGYGFER